jgi:hypothetical protein
MESIDNHNETLELKDGGVSEEEGYVFEND